MKVLFLDIDGVLNSTERAKNNIPYSHLIPAGLAFLRHLRLHDVNIVVSSTWRIGRTIDELSNILSIKVHDVTPISHSLRLSNRGKEIQAWLDANGPTDYCIIDDDGDMLPEQMPRFVRTECEYGIQQVHMNYVCRVLGVPSNPTDHGARSAPVHPVVGCDLSTGAKP